MVGLTGHLYTVGVFYLQYWLLSLNYTRSCFSIKLRTNCPKSLSTSPRSLQMISQQETGTHCLSSILQPIYLHTPSQPMGLPMLYLLTDQINHQIFWVFNWVKLSSVSFKSNHIKTWKLYLKKKKPDEKYLKERSLHLLNRTLLSYVWIMINNLTNHNTTKLPCCWSHLSHDLSTWHIRVS